MPEEGSRCREEHWLLWSSSSMEAVHLTAEGFYGQRVPALDLEHCKP